MKKLIELPTHDGMEDFICLMTMNQWLNSPKDE